MVEIRRADPAVRRRALLVFVVGICIGALCIVALERYRVPLSDWILADRALSARRLRLAFLVLAGLLVMPTFAFGFYLWALGARVVQAGEFPPPGLRVIRDTPVATGESAASRGRSLKMLAVACCIAAAALGLLLLRLEWLLTDQTLKP